MQQNVPWPESPYDCVMRARVALTDLFHNLIQREYERESDAESAVVHRRNVLQRLEDERNMSQCISLNGSMVNAQPTEAELAASAELVSQEARSAIDGTVAKTMRDALQSLQYDVTHIVQQVADNLPSFNEDDSSGPSSRKSSSLQVISPRLRSATDAERLSALEVKLYEFKTRCAHKEAHIEALKAFCKKKDDAVNYIRNTLYHEVVLLRDAALRQSANPQFGSEFVSLFDYMKLLEGTNPPEFAEAEALRLAKREHAAELLRVHQNFTQQIRRRDEQIAAAQKQVDELKVKTEELEKISITRTFSKVARRSFSQDPVIQQQFDALSLELETRVEQAERLQALIVEKDEQIVGKTEQLSACRDQIQRMTANTETVVEVKNREIMTKSSLVAELEAKVRALEGSKIEAVFASRKAEQMSQTLLELSDQLGKANSSLEALRKEHADLRSTSEKLQKDNDSLRRSIDSSSNIIATMHQKKVQHAEEELRLSQEKLLASLEQIEALSSELQSSHHANRELSAKIHALSDAKSEVDNAANSRLAELTAAEEKIADHEEYIKVLEKDFRAANQRVATLEAQAQSLKQELGERSDQRENLGKDTRMLLDEIQSSAKENAELREETQKLKDQLRKHQDEEASLRERVSELEMEQELLLAQEVPAVHALPAPVPTGGAQRTATPTLPNTVSKRPTKTVDAKLVSVTSSPPDVVIPTPEAIEQVELLRAPARSRETVQTPRKGGRRGRKKGAEASTPRTSSPLEVDPSPPPQVEHPAAQEQGANIVASYIAQLQEIRAESASVSQRNEQLQQTVLELESELTKANDELELLKLFAADRRDSAATTQRSRTSVSRERPAHAGSTTSAAKGGRKDSSKALRSTRPSAREQRDVVALSPNAPGPWSSDDPHTSCRETIAQLEEQLQSVEQELKDRMADLADLSKLNLESDRAPLTDGLVERFVVTARIGGPNFRRFSDRAESLAKANNAGLAFSRRDRGSVVLSAVFAGAVDVLKYQSDLLREEIRESGEAAVRIGVDYGLCCIESAGCYGPVPTRAAALATAARQSTTVISDHATQQFDTLRAEYSPPAQLREITEAASLYCPSESRDITVTCRTLRMPNSADTALAPKGNLLNDGIPELSPSAKMQCEFLQRVQGSDSQRERPVERSEDHSKAEFGVQCNLLDSAPQSLTEFKASNESVHETPKDQPKEVQGVQAREPKEEPGVKERLAAERAAPWAAKEEAKRRAKEAAEREAKEDAERRAKEDAERRAGEKADQAARQKSKQAPKDHTPTHDEVNPQKSTVNHEERESRTTTHEVQRTATPKRKTNSAVQCKSTMTHVSTQTEEVSMGELIASQSRIESPAMLHEVIPQLEFNARTQLRRGFSAHRRLVHSTKPVSTREEEPEFFLGQRSPLDSPAQDSPSHPRPFSAAPRFTTASSPLRRHHPPRPFSSCAQRISQSIAASSSMQAQPQCVTMIEGFADNAKIRLGRLPVSGAVTWNRYPDFSQMQTRPQSANVPANKFVPVGDDTFEALVPDADWTTGQPTVNPQDATTFDEPELLAPSTIDLRHMPLDDPRAVRGVREKVQRAVTASQFLSTYGEELFRSVPSHTSANTTPFIARQRKMKRRPDHKP